MKKIQFIKLLAFGIILSISTVFSSCSKDDDTTTTSTSTVESVFALNFSRSFNDGRTDIYVGFSTNNISEIPKVVVNGKELEDFGMEAGGIYGDTRISFASNITYSVSSNGKTTSGSITMPDTITNVTFNDLLLKRGGDNSLVYAPEYIVKWNKITCDYQRFYYYLNNVDSAGYMDANLETLTITDNQQTSTWAEVTIYSINGNKMITGSKPNVSGDYGKGYIRAEVRNRYSLNTYNKSLLSTPIYTNNNDEFKKAFQSLIK